MCIAYLSIGHPDWPLLIAANRDEFHRRASAPAAFWPDHPDLIAGRDLVAGGTWLGWARPGRFAFLTNYREPGRQPPPHAPSRGTLARDFLLGGTPADRYLRDLAGRAQDWAGFNLVVGDATAVWYLSNRDPAGVPRRLSDGSHVLSNHLMDTPWPKARRLCAHLDAQAPARWSSDPDVIFAALHDTTQAAEHERPDTGLEPGFEQLLSSPFIISPDYGTRCSTVIAVDSLGNVLFCEQSYDPDGRLRERHDWRLAPGLE